MSSPKPKRALSDADIADASNPLLSAAENATMTTVVYKKDLDIESLQRSVSLLGQGVKTILSNATNNDNRWSEVAVMLNDLTARQDATTSTANQLVKDIANVLGSMRGDQQSMMN